MASGISTLTLIMLKNFTEGDVSKLEGGEMAQFQQVSGSTSYTLKELPAFFIVGIVGGLLGSFFNFLNS